MRDSAGSVVKTGLVSLVVGAGVGYFLYRLASWRRRNGGAAAAEAGAEEEEEEGLPREEDTRPASVPRGERGEHTPGSSLLRHVSSIPVFSSSGQNDPRALRKAGMDLHPPPHGLGADDIQSLIHLLESTKDPTIQEQVLITLSNSAAFSVNQDIIRNLGGLSAVGKMLSVPITNVKEKALNALNNLSMNIKNQEVMKIHVTKVYEETYSAPLDSELQLAGLRFLTNMSVTNNYHYMMTGSIPGFLHLLSRGSERTQVQVLKLLVNLSANPAMTEHLLNAQAPFLLSLFDSCTNKDVLLRVLVFITNLTKHMKKDKSPVHYEYNEDSVFSVLWGNSTLCAQKLASLLHHHDTEVREQVAELIMQKC